MRSQEMPAIAWGVNWPRATDAATEPKAPVDDFLGDQDADTGGVFPGGLHGLLLPGVQPEGLDHVLTAQQPLQPPARLGLLQEDLVQPFGLGGFNSPSLLGVAYSGPYFHDGSAITLEEVAARHGLGVAPATIASTLTAQDLSDLLAFVRGIDDDTLTMPNATDAFIAP